MVSAQEILKKYWNYNSFKPVQEDIIRHITEKGDAFVLMPTGGGKSLCFQIPALMMKGMTIVITPLISLMKDQVMRLKSLGINAEAIYSGMTKMDIHRILDSCLTGKIKLLYLSPERINTSLFKEFANGLHVDLIVADEAHCISQWGYDFRPAYLKIREARKIFPKARIMALTASATPEVVNDIMEHLSIGDAAIFKLSFLRSNLSYVCRNTTDKRFELLNLVRKVPGTGIVYCRNRRATAEIASFLSGHGISADFYHAGLDQKRLSDVQRGWMEGKIRVIVATTAFGMGIDKPDVRFVAHLALPPSPEEYYQEAGRGGRDGKHAYAALFYDDEDIHELRESIDSNFPGKEQLVKLYHRLALYFHVGAGPLEEQYFDFDINLFCKEYGYTPVWVVKGLKELERQGHVYVTEGIYLPNQVMILYSKSELDTFRSRQPDLIPILEVLLRLYGGIMSIPVKINIKAIGQKLRTTSENVLAYLNILANEGVIWFQPQKDKPQISFGEFRYVSDSLRFDFSLQEFLKKNYKARVEAMISIVEQEVCRNKTLLSYYGEAYTHNCGICDVCLQEKRIENKDSGLSRTIEYVMNFATSEHNDLQTLLSTTYYRANKEKVDAALQFLVQEGTIVVDNFKIVKAE
ncbi:MAG: ATP-dependent DNA helicase RecQ [Saprospiraceae bacterium]|nr:MAG: ATP-dependent DNA helicase RecQ [Saprospiraceae bacterium]